MAQWISACLFALSANIDNFPIGIAYGLRGMRIGAGGNLLIACLTSLGTAAAMLLGGGLARLIPPDTANALGCMLLVLTARRRAEWERRNSRLRTPMERGWACGKVPLLPPH